jgi:hypothetical protein
MAGGLDKNREAQALHERNRATHCRRRGNARLEILAAVFGCWVGLLAAPQDVSAASSTASIDPLTNALPARADPAREIRSEAAEKGQESLALAARLTEDGGLILRPIAWKLRRLGGETLFAGSMPQVTVAAEPDDYIVEASYGSVRVSQKITLPKGQRVAMTLVLNVGGIRVLSRLAGIGPAAMRPLTTVYATSGPDQGRLVTISENPGEILRLAAGSYRVESRFASGNATASADVIVKPGLLSSLEIDHRAGIAHLSGEGQVKWTISDASGHELPIEGAGDVVLTPGAYVARASLGSERKVVKFTIEPGKRIEVVAR